MKTWRGTWMAALIFGAAFAVVTWIAMQVGAASGAFAFFLNLSVVGMPFYAIAAELTRSYWFAHMVWFVANWLIYSFLALFALCLVRAVRGLR